MRTKFKFRISLPKILLFSSKAKRRSKIKLYKNLIWEFQNLFKWARIQSFRLSVKNLKWQAYVNEFIII